MKKIIFFFINLKSALKIWLLRFFWVKIWNNCTYKSSIFQSWIKNFSLWNRSYIWVWCMMHADSWIKIWNNCLVSNYVWFISEDHNIKLWEDVTQSWYLKSEPIVIWDNVWIWFNAIILKWVKIWDSAVIWAGAVVTKNIPKNAIVWGVPAKVISYKK